MTLNHEKTKIVAIVQARLGSSRLPLKSLLSLRGLPIIDWVLARLAKAARLDEIIVAVPDTTLDEVLAEHLRNKHVRCVCGPENDVLARFRLACVASEATHVVRVCADNPLIWGKAIDQLVDFHLQGDNDYSWNHLPRGNLWPDGLGAEIISASLLKKIDQLASLPSQREHCLNYIWDNARQFKMGTFDPREAWLQRPELKLDIDTADDFRRLALLPLAPEMSAREIVNVFSENTDHKGI